MQLKRDTDYALRVLYCIREKQEIGRNAKGMRLPELAVCAGVPKLAIKRICDLLSDRNILQYRSMPSAKERTKEEKAYYSRDGFAGLTLLDVVEATEGTGKVFAVFDKQSPMYRNCETQILAVQDKTEHALRDISLKSFLKMHNNLLYL